MMISVITPLYNSKSTIEETILSVLNQTYKDWELLIIDDHSTDGSFELAKKYSEQYRNIKVFQTPSPKSGAAIARNIGIENASGNYIAFLDSDDMYKPEKMKRQLAFLENNGYEFTYTNYDILKRGKIVKTFSPKSKTTNYKTLLKKCDIGCLTVMYDVSKIGKIFMPVDSPKREDYAAWLDVTKKGIIAHKLDESLSVYRICDSSVTHNKVKLVKYHFNVYRRHENFNWFKSVWYLMLFSINKFFNKY